MKCGLHRDRTRFRRRFARNWLTCYFPLIFTMKLLPSVKSCRRIADAGRRRASPSDMNVSAARDWDKADCVKPSRFWPLASPKACRSALRFEVILGTLTGGVDDATKLRRSWSPTGGSPITRQSPSSGWGIGTEPLRPWRRWLRRARFEWVLLSPFRSSTSFETILVSRRFARKLDSLGSVNNPAAIHQQIRRMLETRRRVKLVVRELEPELRQHSTGWQICRVMSGEQTFGRKLLECKRDHRSSGFLGQAAAPKLW